MLINHHPLRLVVFLCHFLGGTMEPVKFSGMNAVYKAPGCDDLPAFKDQKDGVICVTSCWRPSREELDILNSGGCVCLSVIGGQPPVSIWAQKANVID